MMENYYSENNKNIKYLLEIDDDDFIEQVQEKINNKYLELLKINKLEREEEMFYLDKDILNVLPIKIDNIINFFNIGEHIFSMELFVEWISLFLNEINIISDLKIYLKDITICYLDNKQIKYCQQNEEYNNSLNISNKIKDLIYKKQEEDKKKYSKYPGILKSKPIKEDNDKHEIKINKNQYKLNPILQYKINKFKNKIKNNSLNKDISINIKGKTYNFKSNKKIIPENKPKINNYSNDFKKKYYSKYNKITNEDIDMKRLEIEDKEKNNKLYWEEYDKSVLKTKNNFNNIFRNDPIIEIKKELFNEKYKNKPLSNIYKSIISEIDILDKEYNNYKIVESYYNKLKENVEIKSIFKNNKSNIAKLFSNYENTRIAEYNFLKNIGELIISSKLNKEEIKEINSLNQNTRPYRLIKQSQRIYLLEEFVNIKNIALSGISNWLRDTSDDNFNILLNLFVT